MADSLWAALASLTPLQQALVAGLFGWLTTAIGAAGVFFVREVDRSTVGTLLGFAAGIMVAVSFWGLLTPAIEIAGASGGVPWLPALVGFLAGGGALWSLDKILPHVHLDREEAEGPPSALSRKSLLVLAITLHNFPEGLAIGVAFGAAASHLGDASLVGAVMLAVGLGIQNLPEGLAVALPLRGEGLGRGRSFALGQLTGVVEPLGALAGAAAAVSSTAILPYALAFSAGAMLYVVIEELIPEAQAFADTDRPTLAALVGFALMMVLDVSLG